MRSSNLCHQAGTRPSTRRAARRTTAIQQASARWIRHRLRSRVAHSSFHRAGTRLSTRRAVKRTTATNSLVSASGIHHRAGSGLEHHGLACAYCYTSGVSEQGACRFDEFDLSSTYHGGLPATTCRIQDAVVAHCDPLRARVVASASLVPCYTYRRFHRAFVCTSPRMAISPCGPRRQCRRRTIGQINANKHMYTCRPGES